MRIEDQYRVKRRDIRSASLGLMEGRFEEVRRRALRPKLNPNCAPRVEDGYAGLTAAICLSCDISWALSKDRDHLAGRQPRNPWRFTRTAA